METNNEPKPSSKKSSTVPTADIELREIAQKIINAWQKSNLKLDWINLIDFEKIVTDYSNELDLRLNAGAGRKPVTSQLKDLDKEIDKFIPNVKNYIVDKYGREKATDYYNEFGIEKINNIFCLPKDRTQRKTALNRLLVAITKHQLDTQRYGLAYWQDVSTRFNNLLNQANESDSTLSAKVNSKNQLKTQVSEILQSLVYLIKANHPKTWRSVLREWGFQREKY
jgi:hypothetical protein